MLAKCTPGQHSVPAYQGLCVFLHPLENVVAGFGEQVGTIRIYSKQNSWSGTMDVAHVGSDPAWSPQQIAATFPATSEGTGNDDETFRIEIDAESGLYVADDVAIIGPEDQGWPPTHDPGGSLVIQPVPSLVILSQDKEPVDA